ncbi:MAG: putative manganese transporter [Bacteroidales bacterium]
MTEAISLILKNTLSITFFVMIMMLLIEYINVRTAGAFSRHIKKTGFRQILISSLLGIIPGCLGTYTVVTLYTHRLISFGAITAAFIATMGDEAFLLFSTMPLQALFITAFLFTIGILSGVIIDKINPKEKKPRYTQNTQHFEIHEDELETISHPLRTIRSNIQQSSPHRALLITGAISVILFAVLGDLGHNHDLLSTTQVHTHDHHESPIGWLNITFIIISLFTLYTVSIVPEHFLEEHLWNHIIKKHFLKILIWTSIVITGVYILNQYIHLQEFLDDYLFHILIVAVLVGLIPESGPHVLFLSLYLSGTIPLSILLANSIVQDGHGALPLFAENKPAFFKIKAINLIIGFIVGGAGLFFGI